jgi:hypothetical protein
MVLNDDAVHWEQTGSVTSCSTDPTEKELGMNPFLRVERLVITA